MILSQILDIGNILNGGNNQKGQADGYNLDILKSIDKVKDTNNKSLLVTVCTKVKNVDESMENLKKKYFSNVNNASKSAIAEVNGALAKLKKEIKENLAILKEISTLKDKFYVEAEKRLNKCNGLILDLEKDFNDNVKMVDEVIASFGIEAKDPKSKNPEEFFKLIDEFMDQVDKFTPKTEPKKIKRKHDVGAKIS